MLRTIAKIVQLSQYEMTNSIQPGKQNGKFAEGNCLPFHNTGGKQHHFICSYSSGCGTLVDNCKCSSWFNT